MAYKRTKKAIARPKKRVNKGAKKMVLYKRPSNVAQMSIKRKFWHSLWQPATATTGQFWKKLTINLTQVPNYTELTNLFDQYKINAVKWTLIANFSAIDGNQTLGFGGTQLAKPTVHVCYDKYSTISPSGTYSTGTLNTFMEQGKIKTVKDPFQPIQIYIRKPTYDAWDAFNSTTLKPSRFLRTDTLAGATHYGPNVFVHDPNMSGNNLAPVSWDVYCTVYMKCKGQK